MINKKDSLNIDVIEMSHGKYNPCESERKKVIIYYFLIGIILSLTKNNITKYELFHLRQAMGWWTVFFLVFIFSIMFFFIPYLGFVPFIFFMVLFIIWIVFVKNAWEGKYVIEINGEEKILFPFFVGIGNWILTVFDIKFEYEDETE